MTQSVCAVQLPSFIARQLAPHSEASFTSDCKDGVNTALTSSKVRKPIEDPVSTDVGDDTEGQESPLSACDSASDSELFEDAEAESDDVSSFVYPLVLMLQLRKAVGLRFTPPMHHSTRPASDFPVHEARPTKKAPKERTVPALRVTQDDKVARAARSILNKLTVEKFDTLYDQLATCGLQTPSHVSMLMSEIFEKATTQHHFIAMYADLCVRLEADPRIMQAVEADGNSESVQFRHLLLGQCQAAFLQLLEPWSYEADEEQIMLRKKRAIGNVKLVGQLMVQGMLSPRLLCSCAEELLHGHEYSPEALESLATLLTVTGSTFDVKSFKYLPKLETIFTKIAELTCDKKVPARTRFLLRDLLDFRKAGWPEQSRPTVQPVGPMTIEEVHQQAANEARASVTGRSPEARGSGKSTATNASQADGQERVAFLQRILVEGSRAKQTMEKGKTQKEKGEKGKHIKKEEKTEKAQKSKMDTDTAQQGAAKLEKDEAAHDKAEKERAEKAISEKQRKEFERVLESLEQEKIQQEKEARMEMQKMELQHVLLDLEKARAEDERSMPIADEKVEIYDLAAFHRHVTATMRALATDRHVDAAVDAIREKDVPKWHQAKEFADILTRASEETRGPARRRAFSFAAGLAADEDEESVFAQVECFAGVRIFFRDVYQELCTEVSHLEAIVAAEMVPTLRSALPAEEVLACLPEVLKAPLQS